MIRIAVVDDVCEVCTQLEKYLLQLSDKYNQEIEVEPFYSGKSICDALKKHDSYDLIFLDYLMPEVNGLEAGAEIRKYSQVPLVLLTASDQEDILRQILSIACNCIKCTH